jgi:hypothetical protein
MRMPRANERPNVTEERTREPSMPVGIRQFAFARDQVASGLKPSLEGLDWLRENGYRTVLHVRRPGEDDSADRKQVTKRGLRYLSLEVSPQTLSQTVLDEFARTVNDPKVHPLFVYDQDGVLAGGLWYLYFRTVEKDPTDTARVKAARLGFSEDAGEESRTMWLAIQNFLSKQER